jgi:hypothetical protein
MIQAICPARVDFLCLLSAIKVDINRCGNRQCQKKWHEAWCAMVDAQALPSMFVR